MRNNYLLFFAILFFVNSCTKTEGQLEIDNDIIGKWKLTESFAESGDEPGTWLPSENNKTIEFTKNGKIIVQNGSLCFGAMQTDKAEGTFEIVATNGIQTKNVTYILTVSGCDPTVAMFENGRLMILFTCINGCGEKFERIRL